MVASANRNNTAQEKYSHTLAIAMQGVAMSAQINKASHVTVHPTLPYSKENIIVHADPIVCGCMPVSLCVNYAKAHRM